MEELRERLDVLDRLIRLSDKLYLMGSVNEGNIMMEKVKQLIKDL